MTKIRIGGVPEHFNLPWHLAMDRNSFADNGLGVTWEDYPGGTGAMCQDLREDRLDMAIVLTEGIVSDIINGNPSKIVQLYVKSPLIWGIHVSSISSIKSANELDGKVYAISRKGSGSHIMAYVNAIHNGWDPNLQQFKVVGDFGSARKALLSGAADTLLWEKFTTKPYVDTGELNRVGECISPWPCFVIAVRNEFLVTEEAAISKVLDVINRTCLEFMDDPKSVSLVADRYNLRPKDVRSWFYQTEWATDSLLSERMLKNVIHTLRHVGVIEKLVPPAELCSSHTSFYLPV